MWLLDSIELRPVELDFSSSHGYKVRTNAAYGDGRLLVNAVDYTDLTQNPAQVIVCEACGIEHCATGNWVAMRRVGERIAWIPAFESMVESDLREYSPPFWRDGWPLLNDRAVHAFSALRCGFPRAEDLLPLASAEAALVLQWDAPASVLGSHPAPPLLDRSRVIAVETGILEEQLSALQSLLERAYSSPEPARLIGAEGIVTFFLDDRDYPGWSPLATHGGAPVLNLGAGVFMSPP